MIYLKNIPLALDIWADLKPKYHTIRAGNRWKQGQKFSPRIWGNDVNPKSGKKGAYHSKQITLTSDIEIVKVYDFFKDPISPSFYLNGIRVDDSTQLYEIANNDGLTRTELLQWFKYPKPFKGQIICWNENVNY